MVLPLALVVTAGGCLGSDAADDSRVDATGQPLWLASGVTKWPNGVVPTCFRAGDFTDSQKTAIRVKVEDNWERAARIEFDGWNDCPSSLPGSNLTVVSRNPSLGVEGQSNIGKQGGRNSVIFRSITPAAATVLFHFGQTLGFITETNNTGCNQRTGGGTSLELEGDVASSVMSPANCNFATRLSAWDIIGARIAYGRKPTGSIVGLGGESLNVNGGS
ncbi:MAG TPA: hypothetical protein VFH73_28585, partial [Polyangia bacterium]|nr:hypothetical protein [Polyangia bacterium]